MTHIPPFPFQTLQYQLPDQRIAEYPMTERDQSKLLCYTSGVIKDYHFYHLSELIPAGSLLVGNNTRVIPARIIFPRENGASIELFLLRPRAGDWSLWEAMVGNRRKFKDGQQLKATSTQNHDIELTASWHERENNIVKLEVSQPYSIPEALEIFGQVPLPPYIRRTMTEEDRDRYQTVFAQVSGAVAAPTASLHFNEKVLNDLDKAGVKRSYLTLHVGAGTFKPVKSELASDHEMHREQFYITTDLLDEITAQLEHNSLIVASGTTTMRVLESLYYVGARILLGIENPAEIEADTGFNPVYKNVDRMLAIMELRKYVRQMGGTLGGNTAIFILPGFEFKICGGLVTNFHQPGSTLMALVAAFVGEDWKKIYAHALDSEYRFLSYGDASLLIR
jgi:S-adenosylmethionine:tRNA ribosyltransferase-isomerase